MGLLSVVQPAIPAGATENLTGDLDATEYVLGAEITTAVAGDITAVYFYAPTLETAAPGGGFGVGVCSTSAVLTSQLAAAPSPGDGWVRYPLASPVAVSAGDVVIPTVRTNRYPFVTSAVASGPAGVFAGGRFTERTVGSGADVVPATSTGTWYGLDLELSNGLLVVVVSESTR